MNTMKTAPRALVLSALSAAIALVAISFSACGNSYQSSIVVQVTNAPATLTVNQSVNLTANVGNDSSNAGVDWSCSGPANCGTFSPTHTSSGGKTVFTAPASTGNLTITAAATANLSAKASVTISIVPVGSNAMLNGPYVFFVQGVDSNGSYTAAGTIVADGSGQITAGQQDYADVSLQAGPDSVTGSYSIGADGRGSITLDVNNPNLPHNGVETFSIAVTSDSHSLIIQFDGTATSSGTLDRQAASALDAAQIDGAFAFTTQGVQIANGGPVSRGGVLLMSASSGTVASGTYFENNAGQTSSSALTGTVTAPDAFGCGSITFSSGLHFAYYAVQGRVLRLVQEDLPTTMTGGSMFGQGAAGAAASFSNASLSGNYVFSEGGASVSGTLALAGQFSADGAGNFTAGVADVNDAGTATFSSVIGQARYAISGDGSGTLTLPAGVDSRGYVSSLRVFLIDPALNIYDPNSADGGGGALVMDIDANAVGTGFIVPQTAGAFSGNYAVNLQRVASDGERDWVGQTLASGGTLTGTVDVNAAGVTTAGAALTGAFTADPVNAGRWTGSFTVGNTTIQLRYYQVNAGRLILLDVNSTDIGIGIMETE